MKRNYVLAVLAVVVMGSFAASTARAEQAYDLSWARQIGTTATDIRTYLKNTPSEFLCALT